MFQNVVLFYKSVLVLGSVGLLALIFNVFYDRMKELTNENESVGFDDQAVEKSIRQKEGPYKAHNTWQTDMTIPVNVEAASRSKQGKEAIEGKESDDWDEEDSAEEKKGNFNIWEDDEGI